MCSMVLQVIGVRDWGQSDIVQSVLKSVSMFSFTTLVRRDELVWMPVHTMLIAGRMLGCGVCNQVHVSPNLYIFLVQCDLVHNRIWARSFLCEYVNLLQCKQSESGCAKWKICIFRSMYDDTIGAALSHQISPLSPWSYPYCAYYM